MSKPTFRELVASESPLVLPGAHDALSAILIREAGFKAFFIGGFPVAGVRYGVPDIGLLGLGEFAAAYRDILAVTDLPALVDADNGYGDVKNIVHLVHTYERMGAQALFFEDQVSPKRCGHISGKAIVPCAEMEAKIRAAVGERTNPDTFIIARTDAREVVGIDEALHRGERYLHAGADGLFIESPMSVEELELFGRSFDCPLLANMLEGGRTPILAPAELGELGYSMVIYGISLMMRAMKAMQECLGEIATGNAPTQGKGVSFESYKRLVGFPAWAAIEDRYR